jgi:hypothetical protein
MKKSIILLGFCLLGMGTQISVIAQKMYTDDSIELKKRIYKVSIITSDSKKSTGYLANLSDSNLYLSLSPLHFSSVNINDRLTTYSYNHLEKLEIKRKGSAIRGAWKGALIGLAAGVIGGLVSGDDPAPAPTYNNPNDPFGTVLSNALNIYANAFRMTAGEKAVGGGILGAGTGGLIGALVGSLIKKKFIIGRNKQKFHAMRQNILEKLYVH